MGVAGKRLCFSLLHHLASGRLCLGAWEDPTTLSSRGCGRAVETWLWEEDLFHLVRGPSADGDLQGDLGRVTFPLWTASSFE